MAEGSPLTLSVKMTVEVWAGPDGDWVNNFRQGWGATSPMYVMAMQWANSQVARLQNQYSPPRVFFAGHSLGGGLASAAAEHCALANKANPKLNLRGITFNASGLHPNTVAPGSVRAAPLFDYTVRDEILTTLQSRASEMPLIGHFLRIAGRQLPEAVTNITIWPGYSGGMDKTLPPARAALPVLFPVEKQTALPDRKDWSHFEALDAVLSKSSTTLEVAQNLLDMLNQRYGAEARADSWTIWGMYQEMLRKFVAGLQPELADIQKLFGLSVNYHLMDQVAATYYDCI
jgi:pimeloyl-ACP methyl ester carboxylesterase